MIYVNGQIYNDLNGTISPLDIGLTRGFGVFEHLVTYGKKPFKIEAHLQRLKFSADRIGCPLPKSLGAIKEIICALINQCPFDEERSIRVIVTGGLSCDYIERSAPPSLIICLQPHKELDDTLYESGVSVITTTIARFLPEVKSLNYLPSMMALDAAKQSGAFDALFVRDQQILEGSTSNFFAFKDGALITPKSGILKGITRSVVIEIAREHFPVIEREIGVDEAFEEPFLTSTLKRVLPIRQIDQRHFELGLRVRFLQGLFQDHLSCLQ